MAEENRRAGASEPTDVRGDAIERAIGDVHFPASPERLAARAEEAGAEDVVIRTLRELPRDEYRSIAEVVNAYGEHRREAAERR